MDEIMFSKPDLTDKHTKTVCFFYKYCGEDLDKAINNHYDGFSLDTESVLSDTLKVYSPERIAYVLAVRVYGNNGFDKRFSKENEEWASKLLENVDDTFKNKDTSPIRYELDFLSSHNGLADLVMTEFRKRFPDVVLESDNKILTSKLKPKRDGALANLDKPAFDVDFDEFKEMGYLCIEMEYPDAETAWQLMRRDSGDKEYIANVLLDKTDFKNCYADVYEDGRLLLIVSGQSVNLDLDEEGALRTTLNNYTKERFGLKLATTVAKAIHGDKPPVKSLEKDI